MNGLLKFRVWDCVLKSFRFIELGDFCCHVKSNDFIVQQFIGIKDKLNRDIYEGDVIAFSHLGNSITGTIERRDDNSNFVVKTLNRNAKYELIITYYDIACVNDDAQVMENVFQSLDCGY